MQTEMTLAIPERQAHRKPCSSLLGVTCGKLPVSTSFFLQLPIFLVKLLERAR